MPIIERSSMKKFIREPALALELPAKLTATSLTLNSGIAYEDYAKCLMSLARLKDSNNWWIGDGINEGEQRWGEMYVQAASDTGINEERLRQMKWVSARIPSPIRNNNLSWSHHYAVASLETEEQRRDWLARAEIKGWAVRDLQCQLIIAGLRKTRVKMPVLAPADILEAQAERQNGASYDVITGELSVVKEAICPVCDEAPATILVCPKCVESIHLAFEQIRNKNIHKRRGKKHGTREDRDAAGSDGRQNN